MADNEAPRRSVRTAGSQQEDSFGMGLYSLKVAARVARVKHQNFQAWAKANLLHPSRIQVGKRVEIAYSYHDLLLIRLILRLRERGLGPRKIRKALATISEMSGGDPHAWLKATIYADSDLIVACIPGREDWNLVAASKTPQKMALVFFSDLVQELENELVPPDRFPNVEIDPEVLGGAPVIRGTRIPTRAVVLAKSAGQDPTRVYPGITEQQAKEAESYEEFLEAA